MKRSSFIGSVLIIIMLASWGMFHVWTRTTAIELGYQISKEKSVNDRLSSDNCALTLEISTLKSSKRLELLAKKELNLKVPGPEQVKYIWKND